MEIRQARKSVGAETIFDRDLRQWDEVVLATEPVFADVWESYTRGGYSGRTLTVKVKYADFRQITRSRSCLDPIGSRPDLEEVGLALLRPHFLSPLGVRLLGALPSNLESVASEQQAQMKLVLKPSVFVD